MGVGQARDRDLVGLQLDPERVRVGPRLELDRGAGEGDPAVADPDRLDPAEPATRRRTSRSGRVTRMSSGISGLPVAVRIVDRAPGRRGAPRARLAVQPGAEPERQRDPRLRAAEVAGQHRAGPDPRRAAAGERIARARGPDRAARRQDDRHARRPIARLGRREQRRRGVPRAGRLDHDAAAPPAASGRDRRAIHRHGRVTRNTPLGGPIRRDRAAAGRAPAITTAVLHDLARAGPAFRHGTCRAPRRASSSRRRPARSCRRGPRPRPTSAARTAGDAARGRRRAGSPARRSPGSLAERIAPVTTTGFGPSMERGPRRTPSPRSCPCPGRRRRRRSTGPPGASRTSAAISNSCVNGSGSPASGRGRSGRGRRSSSSPRPVARIAAPSSVGHLAAGDGFAAHADRAAGEHDRDPGHGASRQAGGRRSAGRRRRGVRPAARRRGRSTSRAASARRGRTSLGGRGRVGAGRGSGAGEGRDRVLGPVRDAVAVLVRVVLRPELDAERVRRTDRGPADVGPALALRRPERPAQVDRGDARTPRSADPRPRGRASSRRCRRSGRR